MSAHTRHRFNKNDRVRGRLGAALFFGFIPVPGITGGGRTGYHPPNHAYVFWTAIFAEPIALYLLITGLLIWRRSDAELWDAPIGRAVVRFMLRDGRRPAAAAEPEPPTVE